jgi:uncharacterized protein (DUF58 family)
MSPQDAKGVVGPKRPRLVREIPDYNVRVSLDDLIGLRRRVEGLRLRRGEPSRSAITGAHRSRFRGRGMDYLESRHYQPGDDIRNMDWRITARAGRAHVKLYEEERERPIVVLVDLGPSMFFATRGAFKSVVAARLAALLGWAAIANHDRIGALLFNAEHHELQPAGGRRSILRLIRALVKAGDPAAGLARAAEPNALSKALVRLRRVTRPGSLAFLISDFYSADEESSRHLSQLRRHSDVVACQVADPLEMAPPPAGRYGVTDGSQTLLLDTRSSRTLSAYQAHLERHRAAIKELTTDRGIALIRFSTEDDPAARLTAGLDLLGRHGRGGVEIAA